LDAVEKKMLPCQETNPGHSASSLLKYQLSYPDYFVFWEVCNYESNFHNSITDLLFHCVFFFCCLNCICCNLSKVEV
jgi:hypothetical protein